MLRFHLNVISPGIVGYRLANCDTDRDDYFFSQLLMHAPWRRIDDWILPEDKEPRYENAARRLLTTGSDNVFLKSVCYPKMCLSLVAEKELRRLQATAMSMIGSAEGNEAQEQLEGHFLTLQVDIVALCGQSCAP